MDAQKLNALVEGCQAVMADWLRPDGIDAVTAMGRMTELLDGPDQREAQAVTAFNYVMRPDDNINAANPNAVTCFSGPVASEPSPECQT